MKKKTFITADIHGGYKALMQCLERSNFNYETDELIVLGDVVDGWPETKQVIDELLKIKEVMLILGNHDAWAINWGYNVMWLERIWVSQGGANTIKSYNPTLEINEYNVGYLPLEPMPKEHLDFLTGAMGWMVDEERNCLFVHGGFNPNIPIEEQKIYDLTWDRYLIDYAKNKGNKNYKYGGYDHVFVGHTSTLARGKDTPTHDCNVWNLDTGGGWGGKLTIMDLDTKEYWQSDTVSTLYPNESGR